MKSADEYADDADSEQCAASEDEPERQSYHLGQALVSATLALAAAMREAARLTLDVQASNLLSALEEPNPDGCPGCGCVANVEHTDGLVCEEYPGCSALMESPK